MPSRKKCPFPRSFFNSSWWLHCYRVGSIRVSFFFEFLTEIQTIARRPAPVKNWQKSVVVVALALIFCFEVMSWGVDELLGLFLKECGPKYWHWSNFWLESWPLLWREYWQWSIADADGRVQKFQIRGGKWNEAILNFAVARPILTPISINHTNTHTIYQPFRLGHPLPSFCLASLCSNVSSILQPMKNSFSAFHRFAFLRPQFVQVYSNNSSRV